MWAVHTVPPGPIPWNGKNLVLRYHTRVKSEISCNRGLKPGFNPEIKDLKPGFNPEIEDYSLVVNLRFP